MELIKPGALYSVDMFIPDYNHESKILWVQELTHDLIERIQIELNKIDEIHYPLKESSDENKWEIIQNNSLLGRSLLKYLRAENIYNLEPFSKRIMYLKYDIEFNKIRSNKIIAVLMCCSEENVRKTLYETLQKLIKTVKS